MSVDWKVQPKAPKQLSAAQVKSTDSHGCLGPVVWVATCIAVFLLLIATALPFRTHWLVWFSPFVVASVASAGLIDSLRNAKAVKDAAVQNEALARRAIEEGEKVTALALWYYQEAPTKLDSLRSDVAAIDRCIAIARDEFRANAFAPFWDNLEFAFSHIEAFRKHLQELQYDAEGYNSTLRDRKHNFPKYPVPLESVPDLRGVVRELTATVRQGQTNYQFASIWEHRRTREVLIEGFKTFGEAVQHIGASVDQTLKDFERRMHAILNETRR